MDGRLIVFEGVWQNDPITANVGMAPSRSEGDMRQEPTRGISDLAQPKALALGEECCCHS